MSYQPVRSDLPSYHDDASSIKYPNLASAPPPDPHHPDRFSLTEYRDLPWAIAFLAHLAVVLSTGAFLFLRHRADMMAQATPAADADTPSSFVSFPIFVLFAAGFAFSAAVSLLYLSMMKTHPAALIRFTLYLGLVMLGLSFLGALFSGNLMGMLFTGLLLAWQAFFVYSVQSRIPFSALILEVAVTTIQLFPSTLLVALLGIVAQSVWLGLWLLSTSSIYYSLTRNLSTHVYFNEQGQYNGGDPTTNLAMVALLLSFFWTAQAITYIVHMTVAGTAGIWYFLYPHAVPPSPVANSLKRAVTYSLGSVALAALVLAVVRTLRAVLNFILSKRGELRDRSPVLDFVIYIAECLLSILEAVLQWFNVYSMTRCAVYGETYVEASRNSLGMMQARGLDAVVNDSLISGVLQFGCLVCGVATAVFVSVLSYVLLSAVSQQSFSISLIGSAALVLGYSVCGTAVEVVNASVVAFFVLLADDPEALARTKEDVYLRVVSAISATYPQCRLDGGVDLEHARARRYGGIH